MVDGEPDKITEYEYDLSIWVPLISVKKYGFKLKFLKSFVKASAGDIWPPVPPQAKPTLKNLLFITIASLSSSKCQNNAH